MTNFVARIYAVHQRARRCEPLRRRVHAFGPTPRAAKLGRESVDDRRHYVSRFQLRPSTDQRLPLLPRQEWPLRNRRLQSWSHELKINFNRHRRRFLSKFKFSPSFYPHILLAFFPEHSILLPYSSAGKMDDYDPFSLSRRKFRRGWKLPSRSVGYWIIRLAIELGFLSLLFLASWNQTRCQQSIGHSFLSSHKCQFNRILEFTI